MTIPQYCWIQLSTMAHADSSFHDLSKKDWYLQLQSMIIVCFALKGQLWGIRYTPVLVVDKPKGGNDWYWFKSQQAGHFEAIQVGLTTTFMATMTSTWVQCQYGHRVFVFWSMVISISWESSACITWSLSKAPERGNGSWTCTQPPGNGAPVSAALSSSSMQTVCLALGDTIPLNVHQVGRTALSSV